METDFKAYLHTLNEMERSEKFGSVVEPWNSYSPILNYKEFDLFDRPELIENKIINLIHGICIYIGLYPLSHFFRSVTADRGPLFLI